MAAAASSLPIPAREPPPAPAPPPSAARMASKQSAASVASVASAVSGRLSSASVVLQNESLSKTAATWSQSVRATPSVLSDWRTMSSAPSVRGNSSCDTCRICLQREHLSRRAKDNNNIDEFVKPCHCKGSWINVHRRCLDKWRTEGLSTRSMTKCDVCDYEYIFDKPNGAVSLRRRLRGGAIVEGLCFLLTSVMIGVIFKVTGVLEPAFEGVEFFKLEKIWQWLVLGMGCTVFLLAVTYWVALGKLRAWAIADDLLHPEVGSWVTTAREKQNCMNRCLVTLEGAGPWSKPSVTNPIHALLLAVWVIVCAPFFTLWAIHQDWRWALAEHYVVQEFPHSQDSLNRASSEPGSRMSSKSSTRTGGTMGRHASMGSTASTVTTKESIDSRWTVKQAASAMEPAQQPNAQMPRLLGKVGRNAPSMDTKKKGIPEEEDDQGDSKV
eukprot:TRINITY_DN70583_c0_g1_i1.p1 TRINITY_DN70583_c0_g1~~TRINITY_DN70583_c0_g1_i1.p1  ORF type:complete len:440 (-),score=86.26 TRINITY_DN70583_c0_g1_i1:62-1381(-)